MVNFKVWYLFYFLYGLETQDTTDVPALVMVNSEFEKHLNERSMRSATS